MPICVLQHAEGKSRELFVEASSAKVVCGHPSSQLNNKDIGVAKNSVLMQDMGGASIGIWCAHGEGRAHFPDSQVKDDVLQNGLAPIR